MNNRKANYYSYVGGYHGAIKLKGKWVRVKNLNYVDKTTWIRWQGPPSKTIIKALNDSLVMIDYKFL